jgi:hypothetical protein
LQAGLAAVQSSAFLAAVIPAFSDKARIGGLLFFLPCHFASGSFETEFRFLEPKDHEPRQIMISQQKTGIREQIRASAVVTLIWHCVKRERAIGENNFYG